MLPSLSRNRMEVSRNMGGDNDLLVDLSPARLHT